MASTPTPEFFNQRTLAAIVFTDVVGFSARMQTDEVATVKLLQRDFAVMRRICTDHEGEVLKTTGDGLLMKFSSAVHAVASALVVQRQFLAEAKEQPAGSQLQHRVGIHLGDVLVQDQDVMGDGVNIASRLQAEAEPGGICISQTVYDVVKNKLELHAVSLGPRDLKNISQAVPAYRLLMEAQALSNSRPPIPGKAAVEPEPKAAAAPSSAKSGSKLSPAIAIAVLAAAIVAGAIILRPGAKTETPHVATVPTTTPAPTPATGAAATPASAVAAPAADAVAMTAEEVALEQEYARRKEMLQAKTQYLDKYDFDGYLRVLSEPTDLPPAAKASQQAMMRSVDLMGKMKDWLKVSMQRYTRLKPLLVHNLSGNASSDTSVFLATDKRFVYIEDGAVRAPIDWPEVKPDAMGALIVSLLKEVKQAQNREIIWGAQAFARIYNVPNMLDALPSVPTPARGANPQQQGLRAGRIGDGTGGINRGGQGAAGAAQRRANQ